MPEPDATWDHDAFLQLPQAAVVTDLPGRVVACNPLFERLSGYPRDVLVGRRVAELWPDERYDEYRAFREGILAGEVVHVEGPILTADGTTTPTGFSWRRLDDEDGTPYALLAVGMDITERKGIEHDLRERLQLHQVLAEASGEHVIQVSLRPSWRLQFVNQAAATAMSLDRDVCLEGLLSRFEDDRGDVEELLTGQRDGRLVTRCRIEGDIHDVAVRAVTLHESGGAPRYVVVVCRDLTLERHRTETLAHALELEREASASLRRSDRARRMFLTAVSHELRTPLTTAVGVAEVLRDRRRLLPDETIDRLVDRLSASTARLQSLLDELIDVDRLLRGVGPGSRHPVELTTVVHAVVDELVPADVVVELDLAAEELRVDVDPVQLGRALHSLLRNAQVHGGDDVRVRVATRRDGDDAVLAVADDGPGIDRDERETLLDPFVHGEPSASMASPGMGIGLTLVAEVARAHGGRIRFDDGLDGRGVSVEVVLPAA